MKRASLFIQSLIRSQFEFLSHSHSHGLKLKRLQLLSSPPNTNYSDKVGIVDDILGHGSSPPHARRRSHASRRILGVVCSRLASLLLLSSAARASLASASRRHILLCPLEDHRSNGTVFWNLEAAFRVKTNKSTPFNLNSMPYHCYQDVSNLQCYQSDFSKLEELTRVLANVDAINGKLVDTISNSTIFDEQINHDMCTFKSFVRAFIGSPPVQHKMKQVLVSTMGTQNEPFSPFSQAREREPIVIDNLAKVSNFLDVSTQQRKVVRFKVCPQATQHRILIGTLKEVLNNFKVDLDALDSQGFDKDTIMGQQIVLTCLKFLIEAAVSNEPESTSWMRLSPSKNVNTSGSQKWEDVLEMFNDLIEYFRAETRLKLHVAKAEVMREGLLQIKDILIDNSIGYEEARYQERLVQKKLSKTLGHSSRCLFTLLLYYLFGRVSDIEVDIAGGVYQSGSDNKNWLCMGRILTSDSEKMIGRGVKQLDRALSLFKFVWETAEMKGHLDLQGHLWCVGEHNRVLRYRRNTYFFMAFAFNLGNSYAVVFM